MLLGRGNLCIHVFTLWLSSSDTASSKIAKSIITKLTNAQNLGGTRLLRGYFEVEKQQGEKQPKKATAGSKSTEGDHHHHHHHRGREVDLADQEGTDEEITQQYTDDYENEKSEGENRKIDHVIFAVHG